MRAKVEMVPGTWGRLATDPPLSDEDVEMRARELLADMSLDEKLDQMSGDVPVLPGLIEMARAYNTRPLPAGENLRLGIPGIRFTDGPRGVVLYHSTCFPVAMARGASWDVDLEERVGDAIGVEARAQGANFFAGVCINLLRHPGWGRAQETYGEDPHLLGEMGAALVRGVQRHVMACAKHFAANSIENSRFKVDVRMDERTLREVYLPHFKRCVDAGVASIMSAYNRLGGRYCGHNRRLLRDILKDEWGFDGFVVSDFVFGVRGPTAAAAGVDIEMPFRIHFGRRLKRAVARGRVPLARVDEAVTRILRQKLRFASLGEHGRYEKDAVAGPAHRALAREAACKSMVLLKNEVPEGDDHQRAELLPLDAGHTRRLAVVGPLADRPSIGDHGSSRVRPPTVVTPLAGIRAAVAAVDADCVVDYADGESAVAAVEAARAADAAVVVVGYTHRHEGERINLGYKRFGGDRTDLRLPAADEALIEAVAAANPRTVVVMVGGSAIVTEAWRARVPAIVMAWYAGMEGGHALADILFGNVNPSAKLPISFARSAEHLPHFDPHADAIEYGYFHGYWLLDRDGHEAAFPFGFGLSYTRYAYSDLQLEPDVVGAEGRLEVSVTVANVGDRAGEEIVQLYVGSDDSRVVRPLRRLVGFVKIALDVGESRRAKLALDAHALAYFDERLGTWTVEPGAYRVFVGPSSRASDVLAGTFRVTG